MGENESTLRPDGTRCPEPPALALELRDLDVRLARLEGRWVPA